MSDEIAVRLRQVRKMYGLSQRELAKRAGVTNSSVSMIEQGRVSPSFSSLGKLLRGIPMSIKDFFNINFDNKSPCFFRGYQLFSHTDKAIDFYPLTDSSKTHNASSFTYEVYNPGSDTGEVMRVEPGPSSGFVVQGCLEVIIDSQSEQLEAGDGFIVEARHPHRLRNTTDAKAILVINRAMH